METSRGLAQEMIAELLSPTPENIKRAAASLRSGAVGGMPTETVYGLAGSAFNPIALARIFDAKERPRFDPLIIHVPPKHRPGGLADLADLNLVDLERLPPRMQDLAEKWMTAFWPGPLTLVLPKTSAVPDLATSGLQSVAIRMPRHPVAQALLREAGPLAAPSANRFGRISPTRAIHVFDELGDRIPWILDGGPCEVGLESTVVSLAEEEPTLLRPGGVPRAELEKIGGVTLVSPAVRAPLDAGLAAPGMLESHYAPSKPLFLISESLSNLPDEALKTALESRVPHPLPPTVGCVLLAGDAEKFAKRASHVTGTSVIARAIGEDLATAAQGLFAAMRELDASEAQILFAETPAGDQGLAHAIQDRLRRAAAKR